MLGVLPAHLPLVFVAGTVLVSVPSLICAGFVYSHCTGRWAVLDNTHGKIIGAFAEGCCTAATMALTSIKQKSLNVHNSSIILLVLYESILQGKSKVCSVTINFLNG